MEDMKRNKLATYRSQPFETRLAKVLSIILLVPLFGGGGGYYGYSR